MDRDTIRRWHAGKLLAEQRMRDELRDARRLSPDESFAAALELIALMPAGDEPDPVREREVAEARLAWAKVRAWAAKRA